MLGIYRARRADPEMGQRCGSLSNAEHERTKGRTGYTEVVFVEDYLNTTPWAERAQHVLGARAGGVPVVDALPTAARVAARETSSPFARPAARCAHTSNGRRMREKGTGNARRENAPSAAARCTKSRPSVSQWASKWQYQGSA
jgi:hypothetical protein